MSNEDLIIDSQATGVSSVVDSFFQKKYLDNSLKNVCFTRCSPISSYNDHSSTFVWDFPAFSGSNTYDISEMYLLTQIQLVNLDAQDQTIPADTNIGTINYPGLTAFSELELQLNDVRICHLPQYHNYVYMSLRSSFDEVADETFLRLGGYQVDKTGVFDDTSITANPSGGKWEYANPSYGIRRTYYGGVYRANKFEYKSSPTTFFAKIRHGLDLKFLYPGTSLRVILTKNNAKTFLLGSAEASKMNLSFIIKKIDILIPICTFTPDVYSDLKLRLKSNETRQMLNRPEILSFTIPQNTTSFSNIALNFLERPQRICVAFSSTKSFYGDITKNPFKYSCEFVDDDGNKSKIVKCQLLLNSQPLDGLYLEGSNTESKMMDYFRFLYMLQMNDCNGNSKITLEDMTDNMYLMVFSLTNSLQSLSGASSSIKDGQIRLDVMFDRASTQEVIAFVIAEVSKELRINEQ